MQGEREKELTISLGSTNQLKTHRTTQEGSKTINCWANYVDAGANKPSHTRYAVDVKHILTHQHHRSLHLLASVEQPFHPWIHS